MKKWLVYPIFLLVFALSVYSYDWEGDIADGSTVTLTSPSGEHFEILVLSSEGHGLSAQVKVNGQQKSMIQGQATTFGNLILTLFDWGPGASLYVVSFISQTPNCQLYDHKECVDGRPWWYDSCGNRQDVAFYCNQGETCVNGECISGGPACEDKCSFTGQNCLNNNIFNCVTNYEGCKELDLVQNCATNEECTQSGSTAYCKSKFVCNEGETKGLKCTSETMYAYYICQNNNWEWIKESCPSGSICDSNGECNKIASQEIKCSYPSKYDCNTKTEVDIISQEWQDGKCTRQELGQCTERWSEVNAQSKCTAQWMCDGDYRYYTNSDCSQSSRTYCSNGCYNGECKSCIPSWSCDSWSSCVNGIQTRTCTDTNNCGTNSGKPSTTQSCIIVTQKYDSPQKYNNPIVLVHGWHGGSSTFDEMKKELSKEGFLVYNPNLYTFTTQEYLGDEFTYMVHDSIKKHAERLKSQINSIPGGNKVDIVAHSMGGLVARYYIKYLDGDRHVNKLIMLGTPNHGADLASLAPTLSGWSPSIPSSSLNDPSTTEMEPNNQFLIDLNSPREDYGIVDYYTIRGKYDKFVTLESAKLSGVKEDKIVDCDHLALPSPTTCPKAYEYILNILGKSTASSTPTGNVVKETTQKTTTPQSPTPSSSRRCCFWLLWCWSWC